VFAGGENHGWRLGCIRYQLAVVESSVVMQYFFPSVLHPGPVPLCDLVVGKELLE
jgi:hypothetical protein